MGKSGPPLSSSTGQSGPGSVGGKGALEHDAGVTPATDLQGISLPPAYDDIFQGPQKSVATSAKTVQSHNSTSERDVIQTNYYTDDRNLWGKLHEYFDLSVFQLMVWLTVLGFAISYIVFGMKYSGGCKKEYLNEKGQKVGEDDLTYFLTVEGGLVSATVLFLLVFLRLPRLIDMKRTKRKSRASLDDRKKYEGFIMFVSFGLFLANFGVCVAGATKILPLYEGVPPNNTVTCNPVFHTFYYHAKIAQLAVFMPYVAYVLITWFLLMPIQKRWFVRRKLRQWARLLDADQDGVISQEDMKRTNEKLERLRQLIGARKSALSASDQKKWWNEHVFKYGPGKDISVDQYVVYMEGIIGVGTNQQRAISVKPAITGWFNFFTNAGFLKKKIILGEEDFVKFWTILANVDERHSQAMLKHFPTPLTMTSFREDFKALLSNPDFFDEYSNRVFNVIKFRPKSVCCKV